MKITLTKRTPGKKENVKLRKESCVPIVCYGNKKETMHFSVTDKELTKCLRSDSLVFDTEGDMVGTQIFLQEKFYNPIRGNLVHADFLFVDKGVKIEHEVPLEFVGVAPGVKSVGGFEERVLQNVEVRGLASEIPSKIEVDLSSLMEIGSHILAKDIKLPASLELMTNPEEIVAVLTTQQKAVEEEKTEEVDFSKIEVKTKKSVDTDESTK